MHPVDTESVFIGIIFSGVSGHAIGHEIDFPIRVSPRWD